MADLFKVQNKHMEKVLKSSTVLHADDLISRAIFEVSTTAYEVIRMYQAQRVHDTKVDEKKIKELLMLSVEWITTLFYIIDLEPPEMEDVTDYADEFETEIAVDPILSSLNLQRTLAEFSLEYFCAEEPRKIAEDMDEYIGEMLASLELIARRVGTTLSNLIMRV